MIAEKRSYSKIKAKFMLQRMLGFARISASWAGGENLAATRGPSWSEGAVMLEMIAPTLPSSPDEDDFRGLIGRARAGGASGKLGARLSKAMKGAAPKSMLAPRGVANGFASDGRQRVVAKLSFHKHGKPGAGGGGGKLMAHAQYLERDGAAREGERGRFFDCERDVADDARERLEHWGADDKRHFRLMLAPESGARLEEGDDLKDFTRSTMERIERDLGVELDWLAVDHHNTDNPHVHVIVRGVRRDGAELLLPREYVSHGLREAARDVATGILGERSLADERLRLEREVRGQSLNRLDRALELELNARREVRMQELGQDRAAEFANALRGRARELERAGLAREVRRNVLRLEPDWLERLEAARPLDIRRELARGRLYEPRLGRIVGEVTELGPRDNGRAVLVLESDRGRFLLNTGMEEIAQLERGSIVALRPEGRSAEIELISARSLEAQINARADTLLDRELDRIARGQKRELPKLERVETALMQRAQWLERAGLGQSSESGKFYFRDGARDGLRAAELEQAGREHARQHELHYRDLIADPPAKGEQIWRVREVREMFAGRAVVLGRGQEVAAIVMKSAKELSIGDEIGVKLLERNGARTLELTTGKELARTISLGLGR
jgi:type IV secretory pathway VirD2 relaxase